MHRLAGELALGGFVLNDGDGVLIEVEGEPPRLDDFARRLEAETPPLGRVDAVTASVLDPIGEREFRIEPSAATGRAAAIPPDVATCDDCLRELVDPADRRYRYPFVNCTQCGPRFTIVTRVPYDRPNTTMVGFAMCDACRARVRGSADRRFHAEPIACPVCGPRLALAARRSRSRLPPRDGAILAVKGLGGYHLACDAADEEAVGAVARAEAPRRQAVRADDREPETIAELGPARARAAPLPRAADRAPPPPARRGRRPSVAPGTPWLGVMLPYTPLHHLLVADAGVPLVMTSGNLTDEPIAIDNDEAHERLGQSRTPSSITIARSIAAARTRSCAAAFPLRRSRGYVPGSLPLPVAAAGPIARGRRGAQEHLLCHARRRRVPLAPPGGPGLRAGVPGVRRRSRAYLAMLGVEPD